MLKAINQLPDPELQNIYIAKQSVAAAFTYIVANETTTINHGIAHSVIEVARILDIALPAPSRSHEHITDSGYNLVASIKANSGVATMQRLDTDQILFNSEKPFYCPSSINERL